MDVTEILHRFAKFEGRFAREAVEAAIAQRDEITPELLRILEDTVQRARQLDAEGNYMAHLYAMFLLAQFRETHAYPLIVRFALLPGKLLDSLCSDFLTQDLGRVLASVCGGDLTGIQSLIENPAADQWVRGTAIQSLVTLVAAGQKERDEIVSYFATLFRGKLKRRPSQVWNALVSHSTDLYPAELLADIERAYDDGLVEPGYIALDDVQRDLALGKDGALSKLRDNSYFRPVVDTVAEMGWWHCFREKRPAAKKASPATVSAPVRMPAPKVGRNEPCPCGSGKKYKKCCGA